MKARTVAPAHVDDIENLAFFQDGDGSGIDVAHVNCVVQCDCDSASARSFPGGHELTRFIKDRETLVVAVAGDDPALGIDNYAVHELHLAWPATLHSADDADEFPGFAMGSIELSRQFE